MAAAKKQTKQDLEKKIAELEAKLNQLSTQLDTKPAEAKPAEVKPAETKPAETAKPKGTLPKGFGDKPAETPKPEEAPKPSETTSQPPATVEAALEDAYRTAPMTDFHHYRATVTGYSPAPHRYFVRKTAPVGKVPTTNWNEQKVKVPGYTAPSN
ncbi:MAG: trans-sialidase, partial [Nitrosopumilus sp.]|nr:trans-sialidase [Nitrosopumilus sp.]